MLNLSENTISNEFPFTDLDSYKKIGEPKFRKLLVKLLFGLAFGLVIVLFLPWTQNIRAKGYLTTISPGQRPQKIVSTIAGKIDKWFVNEGQFVSKGDTIAHITEVKDNYFDPELLERTRNLIKSKSFAVSSYKEKIYSLEQQIQALKATQDLKEQQAKNYLRQAELKLVSDSVNLIAEKVNVKVAQQQLERMEELHKEGLKSLTDLETRRLKYQEAEAKVVSVENQFLSSQNNLMNAKAEIFSIQNQFREKVSKASSEKFEAMSALYDAEAELNKIQNQLANYTIRAGLYYITAPQNGYITKAMKSGVGEMVKEGDQLITIMPQSAELAVEMYVDPVDLPLIEKEQKVRFIFDGWPVLVFSGWPGLSFGTFGGKVIAMDNYISENGKYRVLVGPDDGDLPWPKALRFGSGANAMALLNDVPIWYELWRQLNSFPPDYYVVEGDKEEKKK